LALRITSDNSSTTKSIVKKEVLTVSKSIVFFIEGKPSTTKIRSVVVGRISISNGSLRGTVSKNPELI
jgi:hypothetical protein